jgi:drug/metabolite transporter (DMT)-like permease
VLVVELVGSVIAAAAAWLTGEPSPSGSGLGLGLAAGAVGMVAILCLYQGLAVGRMGVVAPVAAVIGVSFPVIVGMATEGLPATVQILGIALGIVAVVLVSRVPGPTGGRSGIEFAIAAGFGIGGFSVLISQLPEGEVLWPLAALRLLAIPVIAILVLVGRQPWRLPRRAIGAAAMIGVIDLVGNLMYILATQTGQLAIAAVLSSLYPIVTVVLAIAFLGERLTRTHAIGIAVAALAVACIAGG